MGKPGLLHIPLMGRTASFVRQYGQEHWSQLFLWVGIERLSDTDVQKRQVICDFW